MVTLPEHIPTNDAFGVTASNLIEHGRDDEAALHMRQEQDRATQIMSIDSFVLDHTGHEHIALLADEVATSVSGEHHMSYQLIASGLTI